MTAIPGSIPAITTQKGHTRQVPNSTGTAPPRLKAPLNACDAHHHIYDAARLPMPSVANSRRPAPTESTVADYRLLQKRIGTTRSVVVQPRNYAIANEVTIDALAQFGGNARGVVVVHPTITDAELKKFDAAGVRGIRFSLGDPASAVVKVEMIEPPAQRIAHPGMPDDKPDDALRFDLLSVWAPDEETRNRILVHNPETLYGFPTTV